jgi:PTH1 family peptidyl-tRNA hydrolase
VAPPSIPDVAAGPAYAGTDGVALIVGLGNPGPAYAANRHNVGFLIADVLADRIGGNFKRHKSGPDMLEGRLAGRRVVVAKPWSFMNLVGAQVAGVSRFFKVEPAGLLVLHDELDLPFGTVRLKAGGGEGGHNGLRSISKSLSSRDYRRVRFGIGRPPGRMDPADYVLRDFAASEKQELPVLLEAAADLVEQALVA